MKKLILTLVFGLILAGCGAIPTYTDPESASYTLEGEVTDQGEADVALRVIEDNLHYAQEEDMTGYLSTIISSGHEETEAELVAVFEEYDLQHTLLRAEVLEQNPDRILIRSEQQTIMLDAISGVAPYRNHIAEANHTLVKEKGIWKIEESIMTDTKFID